MLKLILHYYNTLILTLNKHRYYVTVILCKNWLSPLNTSYSTWEARTRGRRTLNRDCQPVVTQTLNRDCQPAVTQTLNRDCQPVVTQTFNRDCQPVVTQTLNRDCQPVVTQTTGTVSQW